MAGGYWSSFADWIVKWYPTPAANNTFTLLGAIATACATVVALTLAQQQTRRLEKERLERALAMAVIVLPRLRSSVDSVRILIAKLAFDEAAQAMHGHYGNAVQAVMTDLQNPIDGLDLESAHTLAPLGGGISTKLTIGFAALGVAQNRRLELHPYGMSNTAIDARCPPKVVRDMKTYLEQAHSSLTEAVSALRVELDRLAARRR